MSEVETPPRPLAYRPKEAAVMLGVSRSTIFQMIADGKLAARKFGAATVIPHAELARVLDAAPLCDAAEAAARRRPGSESREV